MEPKREEATRRQDCELFASQHHQHVSLYAGICSLIEQIDEDGCALCVCVCAASTYRTPSRGDCRLFELRPQARCCKLLDSYRGEIQADKLIKTDQSFAFSVTPWNLRQTLLKEVVVLFTFVNRTLRKEKNFSLPLDCSNLTFTEEEESVVLHNRLLGRTVANTFQLDGLFSLQINQTTTAVC